MRSLIYLTILCLTVVGCVENNTPTAQYKQDAEVAGFEIITIDSCQYIYRWDGYHAGSAITHKGNCNNPIHLKQK